MTFGKSIRFQLPAISPVPASANPLDPAARGEAHLHALLARVVTESTQALLICDARQPGRPVAHVNREFEQLTGWGAQAALGKSLSKLLRPPGGQFEWERVESVMSGSQPWRKTLPAARRDGTVFWADVHLYPLTEGDVISHWVGTLSDVTENLELHDALHQSEAQHRLLAENIRDLITVCHDDGRCAFASSSCQAMLGYRPEEIVGAQFRDFVHPDDRAAFDRLIEAHFQDRNEGVIVQRLRRKDGSWLWTEMTSKTRRDPASQRAQEMISTTRDISRRHAAEEKLRSTHALLDAVYEAVPIGLALIDNHGAFVQCNRAFAALFGLRAVEIPGRAASTLIPAGPLARATAAQGTPCDAECAAPGGKLFPTELTVLPLSTAGDNARLLVLSDVRERRKIESRLREAGQLESLGTLAGGIAHDFNNMLAIVLGYASLLRDAAGEPARIIHYADTIIDAGRRGADVVRQLQLFANTQDADLAPANVHALLDECIARVCAGWPANVEIVRHFNALDPVLTVDAHQLTQAIQKLLENARDAMPRGGRLVVRTADVRQAHFAPGSGGPEQKQFLRISIEDSGGGMDAETRARMFEPFFARNKNPETRGLGLAVVYGIIRAHHGTIEVDSAPGEGTRVYLVFPRAVSKTEFTSPPFPDTSAAATDRRTILLVEDEQDIGSLWLEVLPAAGWRVLWARDGAEALRLFRAHREEIALVFTDIGLPVMDGWQVAEAIRREVPGMPLLVASGAFRPGDRQRGLADPVAYLSKPYVPTKVINQIRALIPA
ncbi:hypothetical protein DB347_16505 [Opitutaceae bacterium EW11]|nr:hypothetical protein DB347_16505 [Opitutaceae bacterium EW11]